MRPERSRTSFTSAQQHRQQYGHCGRYYAGADRFRDRIATIGRPRNRRYFGRNTVKRRTLADYLQCLNKIREILMRILSARTHVSYFTSFSVEFPNLIILAKCSRCASSTVCSLASLSIIPLCDVTVAFGPSSDGKTVRRIDRRADIGRGFLTAVTDATAVGSARFAAAAFASNDRPKSLRCLCGAE